MGTPLKVTVFPATVPRITFELPDLNSVLLPPVPITGQEFAAVGAPGFAVPGTHRIAWLAVGSSIDRIGSPPPLNTRLVTCVFNVIVMSACGMRAPADVGVPPEQFSTKSP